MSDYQREIREQADRIAGELGLELEDDTRGRTEAETADVYATQGRSDWANEARNDFQLSVDVRRRLRLKW